MAASSLSVRECTRSNGNGEAGILRSYRVTKHFDDATHCFSANDDDALETSSSVTLAPLWVEDAVIGLEAKLPAHGWVRTPLLVSYFLKNHSDYMITLRMTMEASDAFMFAGQKQVRKHLKV